MTTPAFSFLLPAFQCIALMLNYMTAPAQDYHVLPDNLIRSSSPIPLHGSSRKGLYNLSVQLGFNDQHHPQMRIYVECQETSLPDPHIDSLVLLTNRQESMPVIIRIADTLTASTENILRYSIDFELDNQITTFMQQGKVRSIECMMGGETPIAASIRQATAAATK